jgi:hypothetical protein
MNACGELVDTGLLPTQIKDADLGVWHTTVEAGLGIWLVLAVAVTPRWASSHCGRC